MQARVKKTPKTSFYETLEIKTPIVDRGKKGYVYSSIDHFNEDKKKSKEDDGGFSSKYKNSILSSLTYTSPKRNSNLHLFGDMTGYDIHWVTLREAKEFMLNNFNMNISGRETPLYSRDGEPVKGRDNYIKYVCSEHMFTKNTNKYKQINKIGSWEIIPDRRPSPSWQAYSTDQERVFCLGCALGNKKLKRYVMSAINVDNDTVCLYEMSPEIASLIKSLFNKNKGDRYKNTPQWLYDHDITITQSVERKNAGGRSFNKFVNEVDFQKTKYINLSGQILLPNASYVIWTQAILNSLRLHNYTEESRYNHGSAGREPGKNLYKQHCNGFSKANVCDIDIDEGLVSFFDPREGTTYNKFELLSDQGQEDTEATFSDHLEF